MSMLQLNHSSPDVVDPSTSRSRSHIYRMERELENHIKESMEESKALYDSFQNEIALAREASKRRSGERDLKAKQQKAKLKEAIAITEREKSDAIQHAELLQHQLTIAADEIRRSRDRVFLLEAEAQSLRARPPEVVERADPESVAEVIRLRDRAAFMGEQTRRAHIAAAEAREEVGREVAVSQGLQRDIENSRRALLALQGSLADSAEESAGLKRELEAERVKVAISSRQLECSSERHENVMQEARKDSTALRRQRDSFGQECAVLGAKLHRLRREQGTRWLVQILREVHDAAMRRRFRIWLMFTTSIQQLEEGNRHAIEIDTFKADLQDAERDLKESRGRTNALERSREGVAEAVSAATRRRGGIAAAVEDRGQSILSWCFWGWARVARAGDIARATRVRRESQAKELQSTQELLQATVDRARNAENKGEERRKAIEVLDGDVALYHSELEVMRVALDSTQSLVFKLRSHALRGGVARLLSVSKKAQQRSVARYFVRWARVCMDAASPSGGSYYRGVHVTETEGVALENETALVSPPGQGSHQRLSHTWTEKPRLVVLEGGRFTSRYSSGFPRTRDEAADGDLPEAKDDHDEEESSSFSAQEVKTDDVTPKGQRSQPSLQPELLGVHPGGILKSTPSQCAEPSPVAQEEKRDVEGTSEKKDTPAAASTSAGPSEVPSSTSETQGHQRVREEEVVSVDVPRLMLSLQMAIGEELYAGGERLLRCVEADHEEIHGKPYHPLPLTGAERAQFRAALEDMLHGQLRQHILVFLQAQESSRVMASEKDEMNSSERCSGMDIFREEQARTSTTKPSRDCCPTTRRFEQDLRHEKLLLCDMSTGPLSTIPQKKRAARILRDRLMHLLDFTEEVWGTHRRPWQTQTSVKGRPIRRSKMIPTSNTRNRSTRNNANRKLSPGPSPYQAPGELCKSRFLDSGAGPREFWEALRGPKFVDASWNTDTKVVEDRLWELSILVREQDRGKGLALRRNEHMRRVLDMRVYELLLLQLRTQLVWGGFESILPSRGKSPPCLETKSKSRRR